jgi:alkylation response protein AidB-like acyl-CoA dehydrogenase
MDFDISESQQAVNDQADRFFTDSLPMDRLHKAFDGDDELSASIWRGMLDLGLGAVTAPEEHGGLGLGMLGAASLSERIGWAAAPGPWIGHVLAAHAIAQAGSEAQKARWLPSLASGEMVGAVALMEGDEWRPDHWRTDGEDRATGVKDYVMGLEEADLFVVGLAGGRIGLVEAEAPGVTRAVWPSTDRTRPVGRLTLDQAPIDLAPVPFGEMLVNAALVLTAADAHGGSARMLADIVDYSKTRIQFDRPIGGFQAVKHKLADLALWVAPNGALCREAGATLDQAPEAASLAASTAKAHVTDISAHVVRVATESYGGIGYTWEHSAHIWLRRSMFNHAWLGSPTAHRARAADLSGW